MATRPSPPGRESGTAFNLGIYSLSQVVNAFLALLLLAILARSLGRAGFGEFSFAYVVAALAALLADFGLGPWLTRSVAQRPAESGRLLRQILRARVGLVLAAWVLVLTLSALYLQDAQRLAGVALLLAYLTAFGYVMVFESLLMGRQRAGAVAASVVGGKLLELTAVVLWLRIAGGLTVPGAAAAMVIACCIRVVAVWRLSRALLARTPPAVPGTSPPDLLPRALLRDALPFALGAIVWTAYFKVDVLILERLTTPEKLGLYTAAYRVLEALMLIPRSVVGVTFPVVSEAWIARDFRDGVLSGPARGLIAAGLACAAGVWAVAPDALSFLFGAAFMEGTGVLRVLAAAMTPLFLNQFLGMVLSATHRQAEWVRLTLLGLGVNVCSNILLIPSMGIAGAAWATVASETVMLGLLWTLVVRRHGPLLRAAWLGRVLASALGMGTLVHLLPLPLLARVAVGVPVFLALAAVFKVFSRGEWTLAMTTVRRLPLVFTRSPVEGYRP